MNSLWFEKDLKTATDMARIHHQLSPETLYYEAWIDKVRPSSRFSQAESPSINRDNL